MKVTLHHLNTTIVKVKQEIAFKWKIRKEDLNTTIVKIKQDFICSQK